MSEEQSMKRYILFIPIILITAGCFAPTTINNNLKNESQLNPEITKNELTRHIEYLASDELGGRFPGTHESKLAQEYIISQLNKSGITPFFDDGYLQKFDFVSNVITIENNSFSINEKNFVLAEDYIPLGFSENATLKAGVVFVGFGFAIDDSIKWNDYEHFDVEDKWVAILRGGPDNNPKSIFNAHLPLRKKVLLAKDNKAAGVIFISQYDEEEDELIKLHYDNSFSGAGIPVIHINHNTANELFAKETIDIETIQEKLISTLKSNSFEIPDVVISASVELEKIRSNAANIVGIIEGNDEFLKNEYIVIGGHYDHLGMGGPESGSMMPDTIAVHNGADDNASGTSSVIEIGEKLAANRKSLKRSIILINFDAEERGILGAKYFIDSTFIDINNITTMINLDMVGNLSEDKLTIGGTGTSPSFEELLKNINDEYNFTLKFSPEGFGPSDHAAFYTKDIPVLFFFTGTHDRYHKPTDDFDKINVDGSAIVGNYVYDLVLNLSQQPTKPQFSEAGPKESTTPSRRFKVTLGIIPSHGSQAEGMEVDGLRKDGPAEKGGIKKGDIIISINNKEVKSIYDYMFRLGELKKDQLIIVNVVRNGKTISLEIQL